MSIKLKKNEFGGYSTENNDFRVFNYMGLWTVAENNLGVETLTDFMTLKQCREFIAEKAGA
jgi:hypothetical protein